MNQKCTNKKLRISVRNDCTSTGRCDLAAVVIIIV